MASNANPPLDPEEIRFKRNVLALCETVRHCHSQLKAGGKTGLPEMEMGIAISVLSALEPKILLDKFIDKSYGETGETWKKVKEQDAKYFIDNSGVLFGSLPISSGNLLKDVFESDIVASTEIDKIWTSLRNMVKICIKYVIRERNVKKEFMPKVDVVRHQAVWEMTS